MQYAYLPVFAFLAAVLVVIPAPWHWRARNVPTLALMGWLFISNVIYGVNAIVWNGNTLDTIPVWCDITSKLRIGAGYAIPAAVFCVCRSLESISSNRVVYYDRKTKRRWIIFELCLIFGMPALGMALHYIVQGHRYDIVEDFGCQAAVYLSVPALFILFVPPLILALLAMGFASAAFWHFFKLRLAFNEHLAKHNSALTASRYLRLMGMSVVVILWNTALNLYNLILNINIGLRPWTTWADVHSNWNRADMYPMAYLPDWYIQNVLLYFWAIPISSFIMFFFFGLGEEARKEYKKVWTWFHRVVLRRPDTPAQARPSKLPSFIARNSAKLSVNTPTSSFSKDSTMFASPSSTATLPVYVTHDKTATSADAASISFEMSTLADTSAPTTPTPPEDTYSLASVAEAGLTRPSSIAHHATRPQSFPVTPYSLAGFPRSYEEHRLSFNVSHP